MSMTDDGSGHEITDAMTVAAWRASRELDVKAILCLSASGFTVRSMARFRPDAKIIGLSHDPKTVKQLALSWGTTPVELPAGGTREELITEALRITKAEGIVRIGDQVAILAGDGVGAKVTNNLRIVQIT